MLCKNCEKELIELDNFIDFKNKNVKINYTCESCGKKYILTGTCSFPQEYHLSEPMDIVIKPKYSLLRNFCPICDINYKNDPNSEEFIIDNGDIKAINHSVDLIPLKNNTWPYQGYVYYFCKKCNNNFKLPFKLRDVNFNEK